HRHANALATFEHLLGKAEAFDLAEILASLGGRDVETGGSEGPARGIVGRAIIDGCPRARVNSDRLLLGLELPRQCRRDVGVEAYADLTGDSARRRFGLHRRPA